MTASRADQIKNRFRRLDWNHDGTLDYEEFCQLLKTGGQELKADEMDLLFRSMDRNSEGRIDFDEFVDWVHGGARASSPSAQATPGPVSYRPGTSGAARGRASSPSAEVTPGPVSHRPRTSSGAVGRPTSPSTEATINHSSARRVSTREAMLGAGSYHGNGRLKPLPRKSLGAGALLYRPASPALYNADDRPHTHHERRSSAILSSVADFENSLSLQAAAHQTQSISPDRRDRIWSKVRGVARMSRIFSTLQQENETVMRLKGLSPSNKLSPGLLLAGKDRLDAELEKSRHALNSDAKKAMRPESSPEGFHRKPRTHGVTLGHVPGHGHSNEAGAMTAGSRHPHAFLHAAAHGLPANMRNELDMFNAADTNRDGRLDFDETAWLLRHRDPDMPESHIRSYFEAVDRNNDGRIDFAELVNYIHRGRAPHIGSSDKVKAAFATNFSAPALAASAPDAMPRRTRPASVGTLGRAAG